MGWLIETAVDLACGWARGAAQALGGSEELKVYLAGCIDRAKGGRLLPGNHDLVRGLRTAHWRAVDCVARRHAADAARIPGADGAPERAFAAALAALVGERLSPLGHAIDRETLGAEVLADALADLLAEAGQGDAARRAEAEGRALAELAEATGQAPPRGFEAAFRGAEEAGGPGWYEVYGLCVAESLKVNPRFRAIFLNAQFLDTKRAVAEVGATLEARIAAAPAALQAALDGLRGDLAAMEARGLAAVAALRNGLAADLRDVLRGRPPLLDPRMTEAQRRAAAEGGDHRQFGFRYAVDAFRGRDAELAAVTSALFAEPDRPFLWLGLAGAAGSGKSRFAMELLALCRSEWPLSGFLMSHAVEPEVAWAWPAEKGPSLLVLDYAGADAARTVAFLEALAERANSGALAQPVRVLAIERSERDPVFERLRGAGIAAPLQEARCTPPVHVLPGLGAAELCALMRARAGAGAGGDDALLAALDRFDRARRPLFAAIVADLVGDGTLPDLAEGGAAEAARRALLRALLARERRVWAAAAGGDGAKAALHERLLVLATLVRGLPVPALETLHGQGALASPWGAHLPMPFDPGLCRAMTGEGTAERIAPLEPDLVGEALVLDHLEVPPDAGDRLERLARRDWLLDTAWRLDPAGTAVFVRLCYQDFPAATRGADWRLAGAGAVADGPAALAALLRSVVVAMAAADGTAVPDADRLASAFELLDRSAPALDGAFATDPAVRRDFAAALRQLANMTARALNTTLPFEKVADSPAMARLAGRFGQAAEHGAAP